MAGQSAGMVRDIRPAAEIIRNLFGQAADLLGPQLKIEIPGLAGCGWTAAPAEQKAEGA
jgi:hypothetical protein